jgi:hypothetical protein
MNPDIQARVKEIKGHAAARAVVASGNVLPLWGLDGPSFCKPFASRLAN